MIGTPKYKPRPTSEAILQYISEEDIYNKYLGGIPVKAIRSPLRKDTNPSFGVFRSSKNNSLMWKDFSTNETGDVFHFVQKLLKYDSIIDALNRIASDFNLHQHFYIKDSYSDYIPTSSSFGLAKNLAKYKKKKAKISFTRRHWTSKDDNYWARYGLTRRELEYCRVFPITYFFIEHDGEEVMYTADKLSYVYIEKKDGVITHKIYQPYNRENRKFVSDNDSSIWELWEQLPPRGKNLIITSSRKDAMVIKKLFPSHSVTSCSLQAESVYPKEQVMNELLSRFNRVFLLYDNDVVKNYDGKPNKNPGQESAMKLLERFPDIMNLKIPGRYKTKDISDFRARQGSDRTYYLIKNLIKEQIKLKENA